MMNKGPLGLDMRTISGNWMPEKPYSPKITRLDKTPFGLGPAQRSAAGQPRTGPVRSNDLFAALVAFEPYLLAAGNDYRLGLMLQNCDPTDNLFYSFGVKPSLVGSFLTPGQILLLDFICPTDAVWALAGVNINCAYRDFARVG